MKTVELFGLNYADMTLEDVSSAALRLASQGGGCAVTPNSEMLWEALHNNEFQETLKKASIIIPDGIGILLASKILGRPLQGKVAGVEFGEKLCEKAPAFGMSVYFLGAKPGVAAKAAENIKAKYPALRIAGTHDGYFGEGESDALCAEIAKASADILFVCLGSPKQEMWAEQNRVKAGVKLTASLGGSLDVYSGGVERAPKFMVDNGLEWLYRLSKNPSRIKRMVKIPLFLLYTLKLRLFGKNSGEKEK